ncbi:hypothetical protein [Streptomyces sp. NPDC002054]|uniref:hypothetical protein n=1 Tax=Streptomyces sp. NPDC002054 TaxID=3154663 RepID=UPI003316866C
MEPITTLAMAGATALVASMATTAWESTREAAVRLFHRGGAVEQDVIEGQLVSTAARIERADDVNAARERIIPLWQGELEDLLRRHPEAAEELRALVARTRAALPGPERSSVQNVTASDHASAYGALHGSVIVHHHHPTPSAEAPARRPDAPSVGEAKPEGDEG